MTSEKAASLNVSTLMLTKGSIVADEQENFIELFANICDQFDGTYSIVGSSLSLAKIISASAASGEIFRIGKPLPGPNMTYQIYLHILAIYENSSAVARNTTAAAVIAAGQGGNSSVPFDFRGLDISQLEYLNETGDEWSWSPMKIGYFAMVPPDGERMTKPWMVKVLCLMPPHP